jgi:hypothetical protein
MKQMKHMIVTALLFAALGTTLGACDDDAPAPATPSPTLDAGALAAHSLGGSSLAEMQLLATSDGRDVLSRVVSCALPAGASITAINPHGTPYSFMGKLGLAPDWAQRPATANERHRVTDCVLGRPAAAPPIHLTSAIAVSRI